MDLVRSSPLQDIITVWSFEDRTAKMQLRPFKAGPTSGVEKIVHGWLIIVLTKAISAIIPKSINLLAVHPLDCDISKRFYIAKSYWIILFVFQ